MRRGSVASLTDICRMMATDKAEGAEALRLEGVIPTVEGTTHFYDVARAVRVLADRKGSQSSTDERNREQAAKIRIEREILEGKWGKVEDLQAACGKVGAAFTRIVEASKLTADEQEQLSQAVKAAMAEFQTVPE